MARSGPGDRGAGDRVAGAVSTARPSPSPAGSPAGRWEKKKQATREALLAAAGELFARQGYAGTTVQQITDAADVSERTFFRYFDSKEDLLLTDISTVFSAAAAALAERPLDEAPLDSLYEAVRSSILTARQLSRSGLIDIFSTAAEMAPSGLVRLFIDWEEKITLILLERFGANGADRHSPEVQLRAAVAARTGIAAMRATIRVLRVRGGARPPSSTRLLEQLRSAFEIAAGGCVAPTVPRRPAPRRSAGDRSRGPGAQSELSRSDRIVSR